MFVDVKFYIWDFYEISFPMQEKEPLDDQI